MHYSGVEAKEKICAVRRPTIMKETVTERGEKSNRIGKRGIFAADQAGPEFGLQQELIEDAKVKALGVDGKEIKIKRDFMTAQQGSQKLCRNWKRSACGRFRQPIGKKGFMAWGAVKIKSGGAAAVCNRGIYNVGMVGGKVALKSGATLRHCFNQQTAPTELQQAEGV